MFLRQSTPYAIGSRFDDKRDFGGASSWHEEQTRACDARLTTLSVQGGQTMEPASQGQKPTIVTAVISGVAVIFAAVIGAVMPNLKEKAKTIDDLNVQLTQLQSTLEKRRAEYSQLRDQLGGDPALEGRRWQISGTISPAPKGRFAVYLVPGNSLSTVTDSRGHFVLDDVPAATYHVLILDEANSATDRLIEPNQPSDSFGFKNATVKWEVVDSSKKAARARGSDPYEIANSRLGHPSRSGGNP